MSLDTLANLNVGVSNRRHRSGRASIALQTDVGDNRLGALLC
jgi:hypothetical protein